MSDIYWGLDSVNPVDKPLHWMKGKPVFYDYLLSQDFKPSFFGRYIVGPQEQVLTQNEAFFLLNKGIRILPVFKWRPPQPGDQRSQGEHEAADAITAAKSIGVAPFVVIYKDIEPDDKPSVDYLIGWCKRLYDSQYGSGFYCNNWVFSKFMQAYKVAFQKMDLPNKHRSINLWCQYPDKTGCTEGSVGPAFTPAIPTFHPTGPTIWQYAIGCRKFTVGGKTNGLIDMDVANQRGFDDMWAPD